MKHCGCYWGLRIENSALRMLSQILLLVPVAAANIKFCLMSACRCAASGNLPPSLLLSNLPIRGQCDFEYLAYQPNGALFTWRIRCNRSQSLAFMQFAYGRGRVVLFLNAILNFNDHKCKLILNALLRLNLCLWLLAGLFSFLFLFCFCLCWQTSQLKIMSFNYLCSAILCILIRVLRTSDLMLCQICNVPN